MAASPVLNRIEVEAVCDGVPPCSRAGRTSNIVQT